MLSCCVRDMTLMDYHFHNCRDRVCFTHSSIPSTRLSARHRTSAHYASAQWLEGKAEKQEPAPAGPHPCRSTGCSFTASTWHPRSWVSEDTKRAWKPGLRNLLLGVWSSSSLPSFVHGSSCSKTVSHLMVILTITGEEALFSLLPIVQSNGEEVKGL